MELFAGVADMLGEGLPLSYLFISTKANAVPHTKQTPLIAWMTAIRALGINPEFTLSDKDQSEINPLKHVWPQAKHQLCLWHILRALKRRLSQNQNPGSYSAFEAHDAFPDIDPSFVPLGQMSTNEKVRTLLHYYLRLIPVVQTTISPPPEKPLARIRLCVNGKAAVFTPNLKITLRIPKVTNNSIPAAGNRTLASAMNDNGDGGVDSPGMDDLELEVTMEADDDNASDGEDGLARCARKQAAGTLEEYEEDAQRLPRDEGYQSEWDEDELSSNDIDIFHDAKRLAQQQDEAVSDLEDESDDDTSDASSEVDDERDADFIPRLKLKGKDKFKATGGKKRARKIEKDANYTFCPLPHRLSILRLM